MTPPYFNFKPKLEDMLLEYFQSAGVLPAGINVYRIGEIVAKGEGGSETNEPYLGIAVPSSAPEGDAGRGQRSTTRICKVALQIRTHAEDVVENPGNADELTTDTGRDFHNNLVGVVMDTLYAPDFADALQATANAQLIVQQVTLPEDSIAPKERGYITTITFDVTCAPLV